MLTRAWLSLLRQAYDYWQDQPGTYHRARPPGQARQGAGPNARAPPRPGLTPGPLALRRRARGLSPVQAASDARARLPTPRMSAPWAGPGAELPMRGGPRGRSLASPRLLGCVLKRLKILMKFNSAGPVSKNGPKF